MSVYVSELVSNIPSSRWRWKHHSYLVADERSELHAFARRLGLQRCWFQNHRLHPHYDITKNKRRQALRMGARSLSLTEMIQFFVERSMQCGKIARNTGNEERNQE